MSEWVKKDGGKKILIKTFVSTESDKIDKLVNDFRETKRVVAVQTNILRGEGQDIEFVYAVFYEE